jgi:predicted membrane protein
MTLSPDAASARRRGPTVQVLVGLMVVAVGVLFTLDNLEILDATDYLRYWPAAFVVIGLVKLYHASRYGHGWFGGLVFVAIGAWMLLERIVYITINARDLLPLFLVFIGGYMVWRGFGGPRRTARPNDGHSHFSALAVMGGVSRRSGSQTFQGADLTAIMGGCEIDLRQASIAPGTEAVIDVFAFWGGIDIKVPEDWIVVTRAIPLMGGIEDKTRVPQPPPPAEAEKRLVISGIVVMGGVVVKNSSHRADERAD